MAEDEVKKTRRKKVEDVTETKASAKKTTTKKSTTKKTETNDGEVAKKTTTKKTTTKKTEPKKTTTKSTAKKVAEKETEPKKTRTKKTESDAKETKTAKKTTTTKKTTTKKATTAKKTTTTKKAAVTEEAVVIDIEKEVEEKPKKAKKTDTAKKEEKQLIADKNDDVVISKERLEKIEKEIKRQTTIPEEKKKKINKRIFKNILIASAIVLYFISINLGFYNLDPVVYLKDLQVFSIIVIGITIFVIERAYKKDSTELTIHGIELLVLSICTLMTIFTGIKYSDKYPYIINLISILFAIYYVAKSIVIYIKMKNKALKRTRDINKITGNVE